MNATKIHQMAVASLAGTLPFPEIVGNLLAEGVDEKTVPGTIRGAWRAGYYPHEGAKTRTTNQDS